MFGTSHAKWWLPWSLFELHEEQCRKNHGGQSLERIAERGGLDPHEALAVLNNMPWPELAVMHNTPWRVRNQDDAVQALMLLALKEKP